MYTALSLPDVEGVLRQRRHHQDGNPSCSAAAAKVEFASLVARPVVPYYTTLSNALQVAIQEALTGKKTPQQALDDVAAKLPDAPEVTL